MEVKWTQKKIRERYRELVDRIKEHQIEIEILRINALGLTLWCKHPDKYVYHAMGEEGEKCPDCGYQT